MNDTVIAMVLAAGVGFGLFVILRSLRRRPVELAELVGPLAERRELQPWAVPDLHRPPPDDLGPVQRYLSRPGLRALEAFGLVDRGLLRQQLRVLDKSVERHAYEKMLAGVTGLVLPWWSGWSWRPMAPPSRLCCCCWLPWCSAGSGSCTPTCPSPSGWPVAKLPSATRCRATSTWSPSSWPAAGAPRAR